MSHEPHETHERWRRVGASRVCAGLPSDPRLRRALEAWPPRVSFARAGSAGKPATPSQTRPRSDGSGECGKRSAQSDKRWRLCHQRTPWGSRVQTKPYAMRASRALWSKLACRTETCAALPAGACLTDGRVRVRVRRCRNWNKAIAAAAAVRGFRVVRGYEFPLNFGCGQRPR